MVGLAFEWDSRKETANRRKHNVGFTEASTVFGDPLSITIPNAEHGIGEERFVIVGLSDAQNLLVVVHTVRAGRIRLSVPAEQTRRKDAVMKKTTSKPRDTMKAEYDFTKGVRGKYVVQYGQGTNVMLIDPELLEAFPDSKSVNEALRALVTIATRTETRKRRSIS
jgi:hypothetical protein